MVEVALTILKVTQWERDIGCLVSRGYRVETEEGHVSVGMTRSDLPRQKWMDSRKSES